jgi:LPXTG-motif cell wall-anchored protein
MSTFGTSSYSPQLPSSLKVVETTAFGHNDQYDENSIMFLQGEVELRGVEVLQSAAFYKCQHITAVTIGPMLRDFGTKGVKVRQQNATQGVFERCDALHSVTWLGPAPNSFQSNAFWTDNAGLDWTAHRAYGNAQTSGGMQIAAAEETTAPAVTTAALTTSTEAVTTAAETTAAQTSAEAITTAAETSAAQAATTAASTAVSTTASAKQTSVTGSTKAGSLQTGDSTPVAALLIAGLTAAGIAFAVSSRRKEQ